MFSKKKKSPARCLTFIMVVNQLTGTCIIQMINHLKWRYYRHFDHEFTNVTVWLTACYFLLLSGNGAGSLRSLCVVNHIHFAWEINSIIKHAALQKFQLPIAASGGEKGKKKTQKNT